MVNIETKFEDINMILNNTIQELNSDYMLLKHYEQLIEMFRAALYYNEIEEEVRVSMMDNCPDEDSEEYDEYIENVDRAIDQAVKDNMDADQQIMLEGYVSSDYYYGEGDRRYDDSRVRYQLEVEEEYYNNCFFNILQTVEQIEQIAD